MTTPEPELANQSPPYEDVNLFESDRPLRDAVTNTEGGTDREALAAFGHRWGAADMFERGRQANAHPPRLEVLDARGFRCDTVEFHPACHDLMAESVAARLAASTWSALGLVVRAE
jgi:putative acyl-CoA dehydrogenase